MSAVGQYGPVSESLKYEPESMKTTLLVDTSAFERMFTNNESCASFGSGMSSGLSMFGNRSFQKPISNISRWRATG